MNWQSWVIIGLLIVVVGLGGFFGYEKYSEYKLENENTVFLQGQAVGYQAAVTQAFSAAAQCQTVPIRIDNQSLNLIAVECLQLAQQQQAQQQQLLAQQQISQ